MRRLVEDPVAYRYEHADGLQSTMLLMSGLVEDFNFAARLEGRTEPFSTQMYLPMPDGRTTLANFFSPLVNNMEQMFLTRQAHISGGAHAADHRTDRGGRGKPLPQAGALRDAASGHQLPAHERIDFLENLDAASGSRSSRPFTDTSRTRSTRRTGFWWAIRTTASGTGPDMKIVSLYVDQKPEGDLSAERAKEFGFQVYPTIAEALRCGGDKLAVDAVLIIGEHGDYPRNEKGQILYPRYEFFKQCVEVFEKDGRAVPVFNDKHLSYSFEKAKWMVDASRRLGVSDAGRLVAAGHLAAAGHRIAARLRDRRSADGGRGRIGRDGLPCARSDAVHGGAAQGRRDGREGRADDRRRRGVESGRAGTLVEGIADRGALAQRYAARPDRARTAARRTWCTMANCRSW